MFKLSPHRGSWGRGSATSWWPEPLSSPSSSSSLLFQQENETERCGKILHLQFNTAAHVLHTSISFSLMLMIRHIHFENINHHTMPFLLCALRCYIWHVFAKLMQVYCRLFFLLTHPFVFKSWELFVWHFRWCQWNFDFNPTQIFCYTTEKFWESLTCNLLFLFLF